MAPGGTFLGSPLLPSAILAGSLLLHGVTQQPELDLQPQTILELLEIVFFLKIEWK